ncbi:MAG: Phosphoglycolate phosphatase [Nitrosomonadaceae bacterium]|nr:Phosphoglycolate phosphatase [Nitrosomonadaceae bacterium]
MIFDLWQTLADSSERPSDVFKRHISTMGVCSEEVFLQQLSRSEVYLRDVPIELSLRQFLSGLGITNGIVIDNVISHWKMLATGTYLFDGVAELLQSLKARGHHLVLLTNSDKWGYEQSPIGSHLGVFDYRFLSYQQGYAKPDKRCWAIIQEAVNFDYGEMLMVGDSAREDIDPANALGIRTIRVGDGANDISRLAAML